MNWDLLIYLLEYFSITKKKNCRFQTADCIMLLDENSEDVPGTVYITTATMSGMIRHFSQALLIYADASKAKPHEITCDNYICTADGSVTEILNRLLKTQAHLNELSARLSKACTDQEVVEIANACTNAPYFYFDASYRVLAITGNVDTAGDPEWKHMIEQGFCSPLSIRRMQESGDLDMLADKHDPCLYKAGFFPYASLVCNIWLNGRFFSRLNMLGLHKDPDEINKQECRILCDNLLRIAMSSGDNTRYTGPLNHMVLDLLKGLPLSEELIHDRLNLMPQLRNCLVQVCCIEPHAGNDPQLLYYYTSLAERVFLNDRVLILEYQDHILLLLHAEKEDDFQPLYRKLADMLQSQGLSCAISNIFQRFNQLRYYYLQALAVLSMRFQSPDRTGNRYMTFFRDVYFEYILSLIPRDQARAMVSYDIIRLTELEKDYQFPLLKTLRTYLECACNLQKTASQLFIHKNTALYRINHIKQLIHSDLEDADQRMQLLFSFIILQSKATGA